MESTDPISVCERVAALEQAVARLEARNRSSRRTARAGVLLAAAALLISPASAWQTPTEVRATRFVLVDAAGVARGTLAADAGGSASLTLQDARQRPRISISVGREGGAELSMFDTRDKQRLVTGVDASNIPFLALRNAESTSASVSIAAVGAGNPVLRLADAFGKPRLVTSVAGDEVSLALMGAKNRHGAVLAVEGQVARLSLADSTGADRFWAAIRNDSPVIQFMDSKSVPRSGFSTINDDLGVGVISQSTGASLPGLALYGKDMKVLQAWPDK